METLPQMKSGFSYLSSSIADIRMSASEQLQSVNFLADRLMKGCRDRLLCTPMCRTELCVVRK
jgi:hypothetical protein